MFPVRQGSLAGSLLLLPLLACDPSQPVEPAIQAAFAGAGGPSVKAPLNTNAVAVSDSRIDVSWQDNASDETGFEVHRSTSGPAGVFTLLATTSANVTGYSDTGLTPLTQYCYRVRSFRTTGKKTSYGEFSNTSCSTTPSNAYARPANSNAVDVSWTDNSTDEDGFRLERAPASDGPWEFAATTVSNVTSYQDVQRTSEVSVCYRVLAVNASATSPPSSVACTVPPASPSDLVATPVADGIDLRWTDRSAVEDGYTISRTTVLYGSLIGVWSTLVNLPPNTTHYRDTAVELNKWYGYVVLARKDGGLSDPSNTARATYACVASSSWEICDNWIDDNCDDLIDFEDPACDNYCGCWVFGLDCDADGMCVSFCANGRQDGDETDVDCGGSQCPACQAGAHCNTDSDCASNSCVSNVCQP